MSNIARQQLVTSQAVPSGQAAAAAAVTEDATTVIPNEQTLLSLISIMHAAGDVEFKTASGANVPMRTIANQAAKEELRYIGTAMSILTNEEPQPWELQLRKVYGTDLAGAARLATVLKKHLDSRVMDMHLTKASDVAAQNQSAATIAIAGLTGQDVGAFRRAPGARGGGRGGGGGLPQPPQKQG